MGKYYHKSLGLAIPHRFWERERPDRISRRPADVIIGVIGTITWGDRDGRAPKTYLN